MPVRCGGFLRAPPRATAFFVLIRKAAASIPHATASYRPQINSHSFVMKVFSISTIFNFKFNSACRHQHNLKIEQSPRCSGTCDTRYGRVAGHIEKAGKYKTGSLFEALTPARTTFSRAGFAYFFIKEKVWPIINANKSYNRLQIKYPPSKINQIIHRVF